jgi:putative tricarboxylic transport membrane protein
MIFGIIGYFMRRLNIPVAPLILGIVLGPMAEDYFRVSMALHENDAFIFFTRPFSAVLMAFAISFLLFPIYREFFGRRPKKARTFS